MGFLIYLILCLCIVGVLLWAIQVMPWIDGNIKQVIRIVVIVVVAIWLLYQLFGLFPGGFPPLRR
jgi:hypothetical protein